MRTVSRHLLCLTAGLAAVSACTPGNAGNEPPPGSTTIQTRTLASQGNGQVQTTDVVGPEYSRVKGSASDAMTALVQIYSDLKIPTTTLVVDPGQIGNSSYRVPGHRLAGHMVSKYLDCGQESMVGARADFDEIFLIIMSTVQKDKNGTTMIGTLVSGRARPMGTSSNPVDCQSTGAMESEISGRATAVLGAPPPPSS